MAALCWPLFNMIHLNPLVCLYKVGPVLAALGLKINLQRCYLYTPSAGFWAFCACSAVHRGGSTSFAVLAAVHDQLHKSSPPSYNGILACLGSLDTTVIVQQLAWKRREGLSGLQAASYKEQAIIICTMLSPVTPWVSLRKD